MLVKEIMQTDVKIIEEGETINKAADIMNSFHVGCLVILFGDGNVVGILTERDILVHVVAKSLRAFDVKVKDIMTKADEMIFADPNATIEEAADLMAKYRIKKLPVIEDNKLVGIITASDLISHEKAFAEKLSHANFLKRAEA